jgi:hypothetical protein
MATQSGDKPPPAQGDHSARGETQEKGGAELDAAARAWLASIEEPLRPAQLAAAYPRIVNRIADLWGMPRRMNRYFEQLLTNTRGDRVGFSLDIITELTALKDHYQTKVFPAPHDAWDSAEESKGRDF